MGDRVLAVNTTDIRIVTHQEAVMALLQHCQVGQLRQSSKSSLSINRTMSVITMAQVMKLTVQHDPLPPGFKEISVVKQPGEKLGMIIKGGLR